MINVFNELSLEKFPHEILSSERLVHKIFGNVNLRKKLKFNQFWRGKVSCMKSSKQTANFFEARMHIASIFLS